MATSTSLNTHTSAGARTQSHWLSSLGKEMGFQRRSERLNGVLLLDALGEEICLGIPGPGNIKERSRCWSEKARKVVFLEKIREVEGGVMMNWPVSGRENFVADPFLDGKPMKLSKNGSDVIFFFLDWNKMEKRLGVNRRLLSVRVDCNLEEWEYVLLVKWFIII